MKINCPYRSSISNICTHKGAIPNRRKKSYCSYKNPIKCELFKEWLADEESLNFEGLKHEFELLEELDES